MADKLTLTTFGSLQNDTSATADLNANSAAIIAAIDNTLSRDGTSPNQMLSNLNMNSNRVINLPTPISTTEPLRVADATLLNGNGTISVTGVPTSGTSGQVLAKNSNTNFDTKWADVSAGLVAGTGIAVTGTTPATISLTASANPSLVTSGTGITVTGTTPAVVALSSTPNIGTPSAGILTNCTGLPIGTGVSNLGTGVATYLANPTTSNLPIPTTGTGSAVLATNASLTTPTLTGLTLAAGTSTVPPLDYTSGTLVTSAASGNSEYDGSCLYFTPQTSSRGVVDSSQLLVLNSNYVLTSSSTALQKAFNVPSAGSLSINALSYMFEGAYFIQNSTASAHQWQTGFGGTATISLSFSTMGNTSSTGFPATGGFIGFAQTANVVTSTPSISTADLSVIFIKGIIRCSVAGTLIPQVACTTSIAATQTMLTDSYFRIWPIGNGSVTNVGNWT